MFGFLAVLHLLFLSLYNIPKAVYSIVILKGLEDLPKELKLP